MCRFPVAAREGLPSQDPPMDPRILLAIGCAVVALFGNDAHAQASGSPPSAPGMPSPPGLTSQFPAGLPRPGPANLTSGSNPTTAATYGTGTGSFPVPPEAGKVTPGGVENARRFADVPAPAPAHPGPYTALEIARSFIQADVKAHGELTRDEAARLTIMPKSFEEMDTNHDNILTRSEYEDAFR